MPAISNTANCDYDRKHDRHTDPFNLNRFVKAQDASDIYNRVLAAIREGRRKPQPATWMWFVFPQMDKCLTRERRPHRRERDVWPRGQALTSLDEARAYLNHPVLGPRIRKAAQAVLDSPFADKFAVMDNMFYDTERLHSSMTIFRQAARYPKCIHDRKHYVRDEFVFRQVLDRYFHAFADSDEEGDILDKNNQEELKKRPGRRHRHTTKRLDEMELEGIQRRLVKGEGCVCGRSTEELVLLDTSSRKKIMVARQHRGNHEEQIHGRLADYPGHDFGEQCEKPVARESSDRL
ncbi:hypothetical protein SLS53_006678 [Cytospora paraplurivora]|uniref:Uncharacterized protein n=1 Tax=Cytospora paraplurivora TaxID=2898453 RepID=A0AAN9U5C4_9PEZI